MTFNLERLQHPTLLYTGILVIQTFGYNVLQPPPHPLFAGHAHTMGQQITILEIVLFVPKLCQHLPMGKDQLPPQPPMMGNSQSQEDYPTSDRLPATPIIAPHIAA